MSAVLDAAQLAEARMLIDGKLVDASTGATFDNINPATEEVIGTAADASSDDLTQAIDAARRAFDETNWSTDHAFRRRCLQQLHDALQRHEDLLTGALVIEGGSPVMLAALPLVFMEWCLRLADEYPYERAVDDPVAVGPPARRLLRHEPVGVVAAITPWNFPLYLNLAKLTPALAAGNTVVLKPAPDTPWAATLIGRIAAEETDIPPGVFNVITSSSVDISRALVSDPRTDLISFTGSTVVGRDVMAAASPTLKKVFLELGGKSAHVVLDDADLPSVIGGAVGGVCLHAGQGCAWLTRLLLPRSRYDECVQLAADAMNAVAYGDPTDPTKIMGPLINARQRARVLDYISQGKQAGARLVTGGRAAAQFERGYFVEPTLFADVDPKSSIAQEEIFGPVLSVIPYDDDDDAVRIANDTMYGLSGAVSGSEERAMSVARRMRTGNVSVNAGPVFGPELPMGGYKQSGIGRENGIEGFEEYLETKVIGLPA